MITNTQQSVNYALALQIKNVLKDHGIKLATAESCTGGMVAEAITSVPGSSEIFPGGVVSYCNEVKDRVLHVNKTHLDTKGPVNGRTAQEMALGVQQLMNADWAIATTGIAGPTGAEPGKPVGTVFFSIASPNSADSFLEVFDGDREQIRLQATQFILAKFLQKLDEFYS